MKNFKEEIEAMKAQIAALENNLICSDGQCGCGCDESPVETEDDVEKLAEEEYPIIQNTSPNVNWDRANKQEGFERGYNKAREKYKFTEEDMREADRVEEPYVKTISGGYMNVGEAIAVFTREELITFAAKLMERTVQACKEAVSDTEFEADYICSLELSYDNQIQVEIENRIIRDTVSDEIDNTIELDNDSVEVEVDNILRDILNEKQS